MNRAFLHDQVVAMPRVPFDRMVLLGEAIADDFASACSVRGLPIGLDWARICDYHLPSLGIDVYPVEAAEIPGAHAATQTDGDDRITVLVREDILDHLNASGRQGNFARSTLVHELAHAVLHVPRIRAYRKRADGELLLQRVSRGALAYALDPENQAWELAGCILAPRKALELLQGASLHNIAQRCGMSVTFLENHLRRLARHGRAAAVAAREDSRM